MNRHTALLIGLALLLWNTGCAHHSHSEAHAGESYQALKAQTIANPEAGSEVQPVEGIGATTADRVTEGYHQRQQRQPNDNRSTDSLLDD